MFSRTAAGLFAVALAAFPQTLPQGVQKKAAVAGVTEYDFSNGLRVLLFPDASSPKITVNMTYLVGSRHEGYGETGMAHLLEHMNFILSTHNRDIKKELPWVAKIAEAGVAGFFPAASPLFNQVANACVTDHTARALRS